MLASELTLDQLLSITTKPGRRIQDLNLTLTSMDAWGLLRKDLINALGFQRAKRFLLRYAYRCGVHEARILKEKINWKDDVEWLIAGSKMHHLTGRSLSYPDIFHVDMDKGIFNVAGYWIDSYEAKQHLDYCPMQSEPICYFLVGYASGYTSECLGKKTIFKEVKCKGKGDEYCSYVGKTVEEWGDEISEELLYYEDEDMSDELDKMYRRVEQQNKRLEIGYSLSRNLTTAMLQGRGIPEFAELLGKSLYCPVLIENKNFEFLAKYGDNPEMEKYMTARNFWDQDKESSHALVETNLKDKTFKLLTAPIVIKNKVHGFITIALYEKNDDFHKDLLQRVAIIAALHMQNEQVAFETEQRLKGELLEQLLNDKTTDVCEIHNRLSFLGYNLTEPHYIIYIEINDQDVNEQKTANYDYLEIRKKLTTLFQNENKYLSNILVLTKLNTIQAIISKKFIEDEKTTIQEYGNHLLKQIESEEKQVYIGISNETQKLSDFNNRAKEAKKAVELAKFRSAKSGMILSSELGYLTLFLNAREPEELELFAKEKLKSILDYDNMRNSELLETLFHYSQNEFNLHKTARKMSISISGMRYRIQKIEDLLLVDLSDSVGRFEINIALQILLLLGKIHLK